MSETRKFDFPTEVIELPSKGLVYPENHPLSKGTIEIKYMTAREEEILSSQNLIKKGVVLDKLFESIIVENVDVNDILIGDKNAIILATRILGYGADYTVEIEDVSGNRDKVVVDLSKVQIKEIDYDVLNRDNLYTFVTPTTNTEIQFKLLTHGDEKAIDVDVNSMKKINKNSVSSELTTRYRYMIKSVDGTTDTKSIVDFINNKFLAKDTKAFREYIRTIQPDVKLEFEYENPETGETEVRPIPMGVGFFWPSD